MNPQKTFYVHRIWCDDNKKWTLDLKDKVGVCKRMHLFWVHNHTNIDWVNELADLWRSADTQTEANMKVFYWLCTTVLYSRPVEHLLYTFHSLSSGLKEGLYSSCSRAYCKQLHIQGGLLRWSDRPQIHSLSLVRAKSQNRPHKMALQHVGMQSVCLYKETDGMFKF